MASPRAVCCGTECCFLLMDNRARIVATWASSMVAPQLIIVAFSFAMVRATLS